MSIENYWLKQTDKPLFPDLFWSRPENKKHAGKLLIIGGNAHGFSAPAEGYAQSFTSGIGACRVMLPDHIRSQLVKFLGASMEMEFAPSTPSGSFGASSLAEMLAASNWSDGILLPGDLGRNSETAIVLEKFITKTSQPLTLTKDAIDYFTSSPSTLTDRGNICIVLTIAQLQKLAISSKFTIPITFGMGLIRLVDALHEFTITHKILVITKHLEHIIVAVDGQVSTTTTDKNLEDSWRVSIASHAAVWWLQNPTKPFQALSSAVHESK